MKCPRQKPCTTCNAPSLKKSHMFKFNDVRIIFQYKNENTSELMNTHDVASTIDTNVSLTKVYSAGLPAFPIAFLLVQPFEAKDPADPAGS